MTAASDAPLPRRQSRSVRNDVAILNAAKVVLAEHGWSGLAFTRVSEQCGLTDRPVRDRFRDRAELAAAVWREQAGPALESALDDVISATSVAPVDRDRLQAALARFVHPDQEMIAARELVLVSRYEPVIDASMRASFEPRLHAWLRTQRHEGSSEQAARNAFAIMTALGLLLHAEQPSTRDLDLNASIADIATALTSPAAPTRLPAQRFTHLDAPAVFDTGDATWEALLQATLDEVGARGFDAATTREIARASGHTEGALFSRYGSKLELFIDATQRMLSNAASLNATAQLQVASTNQPGIAEAVLLRETMRPERQRLRTITLEQVRLATREPVVAQAIDAAVDAVIAQHPDAGGAVAAQSRANLHLGLAISDGALLLADLYPTAWRLPLDTVTVALWGKP